MRVTIGILSILGLAMGLSATAAQAPRGASQPQRRATLLPPQAIYPNDTPEVARAVADELPYEPATTPVVRPRVRTTGNPPAWLNGTDPNVRTASGSGGAGSQVRPLTPRNPASRDEPSVLAKGIDKLKETLGGSPRPDDRPPGTLPPGVASVNANANTAFRGTGSNGAPVYAGPPAYRWYGWGSVTPGANPYARTGQYMPASANWYSITGATPGAFPTAVTVPTHQEEGTEPPVYVPVQNRRVAPISNYYPPAGHTHVMTREPDYMMETAPPAHHSRVETYSTPTPTISQPPAMALPAIMPAPIIVPGASDQEPPIHPTGSTPQPMPVMKPGEPMSTMPSPLPVSVSEEPANAWQPNGESRSSGDWVPSGGKPQSQSAPSPEWRPAGDGKKPAKQFVARGQVEESRPDPKDALIRRLCDGLASGVDVSWTGSNKLTVSFECRTAAEGQRLVNEISARPELAPLQIEFSVRVK